MSGRNRGQAGTGAPSTGPCRRSGWPTGQCGRAGTWEGGTPPWGRGQWRAGRAFSVRPFSYLRSDRKSPSAGRDDDVQRPGKVGLQSSDLFREIGRRAWRPGIWLARHRRTAGRQDHIARPAMSEPVLEMEFNAAPPRWPFLLGGDPSDVAELLGEFGGLDRYLNSSSVGSPFSIS